MRDNVVSRVVKLGPGQYWGADLFCLPEYRNRGIGRHLKIFGDRHMASLGYKEFYSTVSPSNTASLRASRAAGREAVYYVSYVKVLFWERLRVSRDVPQHFWDG
jgi:RimJ/RimL family protein N-acetyltransferase